MDTVKSLLDAGTRLINERGSAQLQQERIAHVKELIEQVVAENRRLNAEVTKLSDLSRTLQKELAALAGPGALADNAFVVLCCIYDNDGDMDDDTLAHRLKLPKQEVSMHTHDLENLHFISSPGDCDHLDAPCGFSLRPEGTRYVLKHRRTQGA